MTTTTLTPTVIVPTDRRIVRPYQALGLLQVADVTLTALVLGVGGSEQNPLARLLTAVGWPGLVALLCLKLLLVVALYRKQTRVRLASAVYAAVVANNALMVALYYWPGR